MPPKRFNIYTETYRGRRLLNAHVLCMTWRTALRWCEVSSGNNGVLLLVADISTCVLAHSVLSRMLNVEQVLYNCLPSPYECVQAISGHPARLSQTHTMLNYFLTRVTEVLTCIVCILTYFAIDSSNISSYRKAHAEVIIKFLYLKFSNKKSKR
jgi:hypothetical protein